MRHVVADARADIFSNQHSVYLSAGLSAHHQAQSHKWPSALTEPSSTGGREVADRLTSSCELRNSSNSGNFHRQYQSGRCLICRDARVRSLSVILRRSAFSYQQEAANPMRRSTASLIIFSLGLIATHLIHPVTAAVESVVAPAPGERHTCARLRCHKTIAST